VALRRDRIQWPNGRRFAFTIVDDTDRATVANASPVYDLLRDLGFLTTKTVWPLRPNGPGYIGGHTLEDVDYRHWIEALQRHGFEIALHGVSDGPSVRDRVVQGLDFFREVTGSDPTIHANHVGQAESLYWGRERFDQPARWLYGTSRRFRGGWPPSHGHDAGSPYFWGDVCKERVTFVRNMVFPDINTLKCDPLMPYHDPRRPDVRYWFSSSHGSGIRDFCELISERNQDRLVAEGGACIVHTHLGSRFDLVGQGMPSGRMEERFVRLLRRLANLPGWFVPASVLLDHVGEQRGWLSVDGRRNSMRRSQLLWLAANARQMRPRSSRAPMVLGSHER
jgi:hypothetical protein